MSHIAKKELYDFCVVFATDRLARLNAQIAGIGNALAAETKSSAGDKHETGRAMLQLEREKLGKQLLEAERMLLTVQRIPLSTSADRVVPGSLVQTDNQFYYIAISAGKYEVCGQIFFCVSPGTPVAQKLLGRMVGELFIMNKKEQTILTIS
ncbi:MAG: 3-oxoacyl-ACP synthase [Bacteroidota bacterium]